MPRAVVGLRISTVLLALVAILPLTKSSIWELDSDIGPLDGYYYGRHVYTSRDGPFGTDGVSYIEMDATVDIKMEEDNIDEDVSLRVVFFHLPEFFDNAGVLSNAVICGGDVPAGSSNVQSTDYTVTASGTVPLNAYYEVGRSGVSYVSFAVCSSKHLGSHLEGTLTFRNPYGYLEAVIYGLFPYHGIEVVLLALVAAWFATLMRIHRREIIPVQMIILAVLLLAVAESATWLALYDEMNRTGEPVCCPFPALLNGSILLEVAKKLVVRVLLLLVCLGYGIVRPKLSRKEGGNLLALGFLFTVFNVGSAIATMQKSSDLNATDVDQAHDTGLAPAGWAVFAFLTDVAFIGWIGTALFSTKRALNLNNESFKLKMYTALSHIIVGFLCVGVLLVFVMVLSRLGAFTWPWQVTWLVDMFWRVLTMGVLAAVAHLWRPSPSSSLYLFSAQLSVEEGGGGGSTNTLVSSDGSEGGVWGGGRLEEWPEQGQQVGEEQQQQQAERGDNAVTVQFSARADEDDFNRV